MNETTADFSSPLDKLDNATHYWPRMGQGGWAQRITTREHCQDCGGTLLIVTERGVRATFVRLHMNCKTPQIAKLGNTRQVKK